MKTIPEKPVGFLPCLDKFRETVDEEGVMQEHDRLVALAPWFQHNNFRNPDIFWIKGGNHVGMFRSLTSIALKKHTFNGN